MISFKTKPSKKEKNLRISQFKKKYSVTTASLSLVTGISTSSITNYELGLRKPSRAFLQILNIIDCLFETHPEAVYHLFTKHNVSIQTRPNSSHLDELNDLLSTA